MSDDHEMEESLEEMEFTRRKAIHAVVSFALSGLVMVVLVGVVFFLVSRAPTADTAEPAPLVPIVDVLEVREEDHTLKIVTQGVVESVQEVTLSAEVGGRVVWVAPNLLKGAQVFGKEGEQGEVLVRIDKADYESALKSAVASREDANLLLEQEKARREQALRDWKKLGRGEPSELVLRTPHIEAAQARLDSAEEEVKRARRDLARTEIRAPFSGVVNRKSVELGAVLAPGSMVAQVYSTTELEVRLPVSLEDFGALARDEGGKVVGDVTLTGVVGLERYSWPAKVVRTDGQIDSATLSATVIVRIGEAPDNPAYLRLPPVGMFLEATIPGMVLEDVIELPRKTLRDGSRVLVVHDVSEENAAGEMKKVRKTKELRVDVLRTMRKTVLVREDGRDGVQLPEADRLKDGDEAVLTRMSGSVRGLEVEVKKRFGSIAEWEEAVAREEDGKESAEEERSAEEDVRP